jgi:glycerophosphoryl diester phosphodiesterase
MKQFIIFSKYFFPVAFMLVTGSILPLSSLAQKQMQTLNISGLRDLQEFFRYTPDRIPQVAGHRGGASKGYPENALATFEHTLTIMPVFFEVDPRLTKDSVIVVMHDATLDRTTNGKGKLSDHTWEEVKQLKLKDPDGTVTGYGVPTLEETLEWARGKTILMLDKKDVPLHMLLGLINRLKAESFVLVSAYDVKEAAYYHQHNRNIMFEAFIMNDKNLAQYDSAGIPWKNIVAYTSKPLKKELYEKLHQRGVMCIVYTARSTERLENREERMLQYKEIIQSGGDIILADNLFEVEEAIAPLRPGRSSKDRFFNRYGQTKNESVKYKK